MLTVAHGDADGLTKAALPHCTVWIEWKSQTESCPASLGWVFLKATLISWTPRQIPRTGFVCTASFRGKLHWSRSILCNHRSDGFRHRTAFYPQDQLCQSFAPIITKEGSPIGMTIGSPTLTDPLHHWLSTGGMKVFPWVNGRLADINNCSVPLFPPSF